MIRRLRRDEKGNFLVFFGLSLVVLLGMVALAFDLGRMASVHTDLQTYADSVALAAAAELEGKDDSITKAILAARTLVTDSQTFAEGDRALTIDDVTLTFLRSLPADDSDTDASANVICTGTGCTGTSAANQRAALFVRADIRPHTVQMNFASAVSALTTGGRADKSVVATATAGNTGYACAITPLMFCLPPAQGGTPYRADANIGDLLRLRTGGNGAAWGPGDFGFIDPTNLAIDPNGPCAGLSRTGSELWQCLVGADRALTQCVMTRGQLMTEPGQRNGVAEAFDVRFDLYRATMNNEDDNPIYAPAPNVLDGNVPRNANDCGGMNQNPSPNTMALPLDTCFGDGSQSCPQGRVGNGVWSSTEYVRVNHNGTRPPLGVAATHPLAGTRYQLYLDEIAAAGGAGARTPVVPQSSNDTALPVASQTRWTGDAAAGYTPVTETGRPTCSRVPASTDPDRRVIVAAGVDCTANPVSGKSPVVVSEFFRIFLTRPIRSENTDFDIWGEVIGSAGIQGAGNDGVFREVVQLYR